MQAFITGAAIVLAAAAMPGSHYSDGAQQASTADVVQAEPDSADRMTVPVQIGKDGPYRFLLDTGAQNTVLASSLASDLKLVSAGPATIVGIAGRLAVDTVEIEEILLGKRSYFGLLAPLLKREHIGADGILGLDGLQNQRVLLDFGKNLIAIDDARSLGGNRGFEIIVRARRRSGQLILTHAVIDGVKTDVVIDTGAEWTIGNLALQRALQKKNVVPKKVLIRSVTGQTLVAELALTKKMVIDDLNLANVALIYADAPPFAVLGLDRKPAMLMGMRELRGFQRVAIDFNAREVLFDLPPQ